MVIPKNCCIFVIEKETNMKTAKIILIVLYVISCLWNFFKVGLEDADDQFGALIGAIFDAILYGILYYKAGIFDI